MSLGGWQQQGGSVVAPVDAATMRIMLEFYLSTGWATFDDVSLGSSAATRKYYYAGGQLVAMRDNGVVRFPLGDHLSSTSVTADSTGAELGELRYKAWGETRYSSGTTPTDRRYTGQIESPGLGLYFFNARWVDPWLGRFTQPDTLIPNPGVSQSWDRYAYTNNNPSRYTDPTGHCPLCVTAVIGGAVGAIVGAVGYTAYTAISGSQFNTTTMLAAAGGGLVAGALIGTGVGLAAGVGAAEATTAAVTTAAVTTGATEIPNVGQIVEEELPSLENTAQTAITTIDNLLTNSQKVSSPPGEGIFRNAGNASDALNSFGKIIDSKIVSADEALNRFWGNTPMGGTVQLRLTSSPPSTPVLDLYKIPEFLDKLKIHFTGGE